MPKVLRVIVGGSRWFRDQSFVDRKLDKVLEKFLVTPGRYDVRNGKRLVVLSGHAPGPDRLGEWWAARRGITAELYHADWDQHGKAAGPIRNTEMAKTAHAAVLFWDEVSSGTADMIAKAEAYRLRLRVIRLEV